MSKNKLMRSMVLQAMENQRPIFKYVPADSWFTFIDNMLLINGL